MSVMVADRALGIYEEVSKMLVLSRKKDETIRIGDDIEVYVIEIRGDKVRLGFSAPANLSIHREEVYQAIKKAAEGGSDEQ